MLKFLEGKTDNIVRAKWEGKYLSRLADTPNPARQIFLHEDFVVKVDHRPDGTWENTQTQREIDFWLTLTEDHEHFAEILEHGRTPRGKVWYRQKRLYQDKKPPKDWYLTLQALRYKYNIFDVLTMFDPGANWMAHEGKVVIYDWAGYKI